MDEIIKSIKGDIMSIGVKSEFLRDVVLPSNHWLVQQVKPIVGRYLDEMSRHYFDYWNEPSVAQCRLCYYLTDTFRWWRLSLDIIKVPRAIIIPHNTNYFNQLKYFLGHFLSLPHCHKSEPTIRLNNKIYYSLLACLPLGKASKGVKQN